QLANEVRFRSRIVRRYTISCLTEHPAQGQRVERIRPVLQRDLLHLAKPVDEQSHRRTVVVLAQQSIYNEGECLGRAEIVKVLAPECQVARRLAARMPV